MSSFPRSCSQPRSAVRAIVVLALRHAGSVLALTQVPLCSTCNMEGQWLPFCFSSLFSDYKSCCHTGFKYV